MNRREELACAAGFFNGEGCTCAAYLYRRQDGSKYSYVQISISQSGENGRECLEQFDRAVGNLGKIYGPRPPARNQKKIRFQYEVNGEVKVQAVIAMLWAWLSTDKKTQAVNALRRSRDSAGTKEQRAEWARAGGLATQRLRRR